MAAEHFALMVLYSDGFLYLPPAKTESKARRFLHIASQLPLDLQMVLANRVAGLMNDVIPSQQADGALHEVVDRLLNPAARDESPDDDDEAGSGHGGRARAFLSLFRGWLGRSWSG